MYLIWYLRSIRKLGKTKVLKYNPKDVPPEVIHSSTMIDGQREEMNQSIIFNQWRINQSNLQNRLLQMEDLPREVLLLLFSYLPSTTDIVRCTLLNKSLSNRLRSDEILWRELIRQRSVVNSVVQCWWPTFCYVDSLSNVIQRFTNSYLQIFKASDIGWDPNRSRVHTNYFCG